MTDLLLGMETHSKETPEERNPKYMKVQKNWQQLVVCRNNKNANHWVSTSGEELHACLFFPLYNGDNLKGFEWKNTGQKHLRHQSKNLDFQQNGIANPFITGSYVTGIFTWLRLISANGEWEQIRWSTPATCSGKEKTVIKFMQWPTQVHIVIAHHVTWGCSDNHPCEFRKTLSKSLFCSALLFFNRTFFYFHPVRKATPTERRHGGSWPCSDPTQSLFLIPKQIILPSMYKWVWKGDYVNIYVKIKSFEWTKMTRKVSFKHRLVTINCSNL